MSLNTYISIRGGEPWLLGMKNKKIGAKIFKRNEIFLGAGLPDLGSCEADFDFIVRKNNKLNLAVLKKEPRQQPKN